MSQDPKPDAAAQRADQIKGIVRIALGFIGGLLTARGADKTMVANAIQTIVDAVPTITAVAGAVAPLVATLWSILRHSAAGNVIAAASVPGVSKITVDPTHAPEGVMAVARDIQIPTVEMKR